MNLKLDNKRQAAQVVNEESRRKRRDKHRDRERRDDKEIFG